MNDEIGYATSGANARSLEKLLQAKHELRCYRDDPVATVDAALRESPELVMGHVLRAYLLLLATEAPATDVARTSCAAAAALPANDRERRHVAAATALSQGRWHEAGRQLEDLAIAYPLDALALQVGHQVDFFTGDARMLRDRISRALPHWQASMPGYHAVLGMHAFGLEENGDYARAEAAGRACVEREPNDGWGHHAVAHVMEMQGRRREGIAWLRSEPRAWAERSFFAVHNWWHLALYHLDLDEVDEALALYDGPIAGPGSAVALEMIDASAMLWRLALRGVDLGTRWHALAERWLPHARSGNYAFNDMHAMMALVSSGRTAEAEALLDAQREAMAREDDNAGFTREVGAPATRAMLAFGQGDYARCVELLRPVRNRAHRFGGSHAQRDLIDLTLIEAASRARQDGLAAALRAERAAIRRSTGAVAPAPVRCAAA